MRNIKYLFTRRDFLKSAAIASAGAFMPAFLANTLRAAVPEGALLRAGQPIPGFKDDRILVMLQMGGGNDGLNTVIPYGDDTYYKARPNLGVAKKDVLRVDDYTGLHAGLKDLKALYDDGRVALINGVGYPNPNRSHFRSMEIWHTASDAEEYLRDGWIGRYFDNCCSGEAQPVAGVAVDSVPPQAFDGRRGLGVAFEQPDRFRWQAGADVDNESVFRALNKIDEATEVKSVTTLDFLRHTAANMALSSDRVKDAGRKERARLEYPNSELGRDLRTVADMILGGLPTRLYYVSFTGFDTHANQTGTHERLLGQVGAAVAAFHGDLKKAGASGRVLTMAFSEFGRRVAENASRGTDHGTAAPMFLVGDAVHAGLHGRYPSLTNLDNGDLRHTVDFRAVYASVLEQWFAVDAAQVLTRKFDTLKLLKG